MAFAGHYKASLIQLTKVAKGNPAEIARIKATSLAAVGRRDEAISILSQAAVKDDPQNQVLRARITAELGHYREAIDLLKAHLEKNPDSIAGHYFLGQINELAGDLGAAGKEYQWINDKYFGQWQGQGAKGFEDAEQVTLMGRAFARHAVLTSAYAGNPGLPNAMLKVFVQAYDIIDRNYWPAHVAAGEHFMAHNNSPEAAKELLAALAGNPNDARSHALLGQIALDQFNFDMVDKQLAAIRAVDRDSIAADIIETRSLIQQRRPQAAEVPVGRVLAKQPQNLEAMGLLAATYALELKDAQSQAMLAAVEKIDPHNPSAYVEMADALSEMRQYPRSEKMYRIAIERAPWMAEARNGLGLLLKEGGKSGRWLREEES